MGDEKITVFSVTDVKPDWSHKFVSVTALVPIEAFEKEIKNKAYNACGYNQVGACSTEKCERRYMVLNGKTNGEECHVCLKKYCKHCSSRMIPTTMSVRLKKKTGLFRVFVCDRECEQKMQKMCCNKQS